MIYLNNAATSFPKPECVIRAVSEFTTLPPMDAHRIAFADSGKSVVSSCREKLAQLFSIDNPDNIAFTSGATHSVNMVIQGLDDIMGGHVITTAIEHSSVLRALKLREKNGDLKLTVIDCNECGEINALDIENALTPETKAIIVNHASNVVGTAVDLEKISDIAAREHIILIVDASQTAGCIPIDVKRLGIDILIFTGHKSLFGFGGIGGVYINEELDVKPLIVGGTGVKTQSLYQTEERPLFYESGTQNTIGIASLEAGVSFILSEGIEKMAEKKEALYNKAIKGLASIPEVILYGNRKYSTPIICFNIKKLKPVEVGYTLGKNFDIAVRSGLLCAPLIHEKLGTSPYGAVRASFSYFTEEEEIDLLVKAVSEMVEDVKRNKFVPIESYGVTCY